MPPSLSVRDYTHLMRHSEYYMQDGMAEFQIEGMLYKVPAYVFVRDSEFFRLLLGHGGREHQSSCDAILMPIDLNDDEVKCVDFERLLSILFPPVIGQYAATTCEEWSSILHLASKWDFATVRDLAVREVFPLASAVDRIVLGRKYDLDEWLLDAFSSVCERPTALSLDEASRMSLEDVVRIGEAREAIRCPSTLVEADAAQATITRIFGVAGSASHSSNQGTAILEESTYGATESMQHADRPEAYPNTHLSVSGESPSAPFRAIKIPLPSRLDGTVLPECSAPVVAADSCLLQVADLFPNRYPNHAPLYQTKSSVPFARMIQLLNNSDKQAITLKRFIVLVLGEAIRVSDLPVAEEFAMFCAELLGDKILSPNFQATVDGLRIAGGDLARLYLRDVCEELIDDWDRSDVMSPYVSPKSILERQIQVTTIVSYLCKRSALSDQVLNRCSERLLYLPVEPPYTAIRNLDTLLRKVGKVLDNLRSSDLMDALFNRLALLRLDRSYSQVHSTITALAAFRRGGWK